MQAFVALLGRVREHLGRVTTPGRQLIPEIDGLRFVAIMGVLMYHLHDHLTQRHPALLAWRGSTGWVTWLLERGFAGVELFFVLSGFILALPFARQRLLGAKPVRLGDYYLRRITRLEPPYLINLAIFFLLLVLLRGDSAQELAGPLAASATYTHNVLYGGMSKINFVAWSLEIEAQFYLVAPLLALFFAIPWAAARRAGMLALAAGAGGLFLWLDQRFGNAIPMTLLPFLPFFLAGFLIADLFVTQWHGSEKRTSWWGDVAVAVGLTGALLLLPEHRWSWLAAAPLALVVGGALRGRISRWFVQLPWIVTIGGMCYTIYLYHFLIITGIGRLSRLITIPGGIAANMTLQTLIIVPITLACCMVLFWLLERPFMKPGWYRNLRFARA